MILKFVGSSPHASYQQSANVHSPMQTSSKSHDDDDQLGCCPSSSRADKTTTKQATLWRASHAMKSVSYHQIYLAVLVLAILDGSTTKATPCNLVPLSSGFACACNESYCDFLDFEWPQTGYVRVETNNEGARFQVIPGLGDGISEWQPVDEKAQVRVRVDVNVRLQQVLGFGGGLTDSAALVLRSLPEPLQRRLMHDWFGAHGLDYNMLRYPLGGTDMSTRAYSYDDRTQSDLELEHFALQDEDLKLRVPLLRQLNELRAARNLGPIKLVAASWSPPAWMKTNRHLVQGHLKKSMYDAYSRYLIRIMDEYEKLNITFWALSPQNEPYTPKRVPKSINFNSVIFEPDEMRDYLSRSFVPLVGARCKKSDTNIIVWDDNEWGMDRYVEEMFNDTRVRDATKGVAVHWYSHGLHERSYGDLFALRDYLDPRYFMMSTEASYVGGPRAGNFSRGLRYAVDILMNLRAGSVSWIDWNLALNMDGGPTWCGNTLDSAILVDATIQTYYKNPIYYAMAHFSRFMRPKSHILQTNIEDLNGKRMSQDFDSQVLALAAEISPPPSDSQLHTSARAVLERKMSLILVNQNKQPKRVRLELANCRLKEAETSEKPVELLLKPTSIVSLAFVC